MAKYPGKKGPGPFFIGGSAALLCVAVPMAARCAEVPEAPAASVAIPDDASPAAAAYARGVAAFTDQRFVAAALAWRQATELDPNLIDGYVGLGVVFLKQGRLPEAEAAFQTALSRNPDHINALANLGAMAVQQGRYDTAVRYYWKAVKREPEDATLWVDLATSYAGANDLPSARAAVLNALAFDPASQEAQALLERIERQVALAPAP